MKPASSDLPPVAASLLLAALLWGFTFYLNWGVFWFKIAVSALTLAGLSLLLLPAGGLRLRLNLKTICLGLFSAGVLYLIFRAGKALSTAIFPFAGDQIGAVYEKGCQSPIWVIGLFLFFVTSPCEEIYWRGYLQKKLMEHLGGLWGWILATLCYALVHLWSGNFMLICAAAVAGAFWGLMYWRLGDLSPVIASHCIWSTIIFAVLPIP
ncbi:MAG: CPBP family intramembrane glutamic endopeptidase [Desulfosalsimonadaceae bacterium]